MRVSVLFAAAFVVSVASASPARAQGALAQGVVAAAVADDRTSAAISGGIGYRFNRAIGFGVEVTHMPGLSHDVRRPIYDGLTMERDTSATMFTTNVRVEIPTLSSRVIPYVVGGGGVAAVQSEFDVNYLAGRLPVSLGPNLGPMMGDARPGNPVRLSILPGPDVIRNSRVNMVLTLGGGASFLLNSHLAVDVDLRLMSLLGVRDRNIGRFGVGASYRF